MAVNTYYASTRIVGMNSGMDTEAMITAMMQAESAKVSKYYRNVTTLEWKQSALNDVKTDLNAFRFSFLTSDTMLSANTYKNYNVVSSDTRNAATITAGHESFAQNITLKIEQLATGARAVGNKVSEAGKDELAANNGATLGELAWAQEPAWDENGNAKVKINDVEFEFNRNDTLQSMLNKINGDEKANVTMTYSRLTDSFTITSDAMGKDSKLKLEGDFWNSLGIDTAAYDEITNTPVNGIRAGQDSISYINGVEVKKDSNDFTIDGVRYQLHRTTLRYNDDDTPVMDPTNTYQLHTAIEATIVQDIDSSVDAIKEFVEGYNAIVNKLNGLLTEKKQSKYYALTSEEKAAMSDREIEEWEALAKSGILRSDRDIQNLLDQMRSSFFTSIEAAGLSASQIGLSTGNYFTNKTGEIVIDEDKLRDALTKDPEAVSNVFAHIAYNEDKTQDYANSGFLYQMQNAVLTYVNTTQFNTLQNIDKELTSLNDRIETMEKKLYELQERYYLKFAAMETALSTMNSQLDYLTQMMAGMYS